MERGLSEVCMKYEIELQPFNVPNFVRPVAKVGRREDGFVETPAIPLHELSTETLMMLCEKFKADVLAKAARAKP